MAKNQSTYTLKIDAELGNLQTILNQAKKSLEGFVQSGNAPKGLEKAFEKINILLGQITDKTGKPLDLKGLTATGRDLDSVQEGFRSIIRLLGEFDDLSDDIKLSFLSGDEQKKIQDATKALSDYGKAMEEVAKKQKLLDAEQKTNAKDKTTLDKAKKKVSGLQDEKTLTQARLSGAQTKLNAARGMENANPKDIAKYEAEIEKLTAELTILDKNLGAANEELTTAQGVYNSSAQSIKKMEAEIKRASGASLKQLKEEAAQLGISLEGLNGHNAAKQVEILTDRLEQFKQETMRGARPAFEAIKQGCEKAEVAADGLQGELKEAVEATKEMDEAAAQRDAFEAKIKSFLGLSGAAQVLRAALRDAMATITELDAVMGQMAVVTDLTVGDYWDQLPEYAERASKLGVSITSAYEAATLYYQQGLKANEVTALSEQTLKMAAIAGLDAADATDRMTAALRGFNMELNEANAQNIADVYSELAAITAADVDEISTAMTKTASIASSAGMEFETTAAFLSQIIETTRESAETAGTAMKTVIARFQELKKSPSEIGEIDGEIVDANAIETALRSVGVLLRDSSGQFRELDEVFLELSSKWDGLDKNTQRYIATIAAGSRQQSRFIAMMSDYKRTTELVTAANTSAGASNKQFEKTMDTLEYKVNQLKNAWHEFTMGIMNSDLVKFGVDVLTKFLEVVNKATSALDGVNGSLTKIISVVGIFKLGKQIFDKFMPTISGFFTNITKEAYTGGLNAGKAFQQGLEDSKKQDASGAQSEETEGKKSESKEGVKRTGWQKLGDKTIGLNKWQEASGHNKNRKKELEELQKLKKGTKEYEEQQNKVLAEGKKQWAAYGQALGSVGQTLTGIGMGMSAIGGVLSSLGLEEAGEAFTTLGNGAMIAGTALMGVAQVLQYIPVLLNVIMAHPIIAIIVVVLTAILVTIIAIVAAINNNSPEAKLKKAQEAAEQAAEAAERASESYNKLKDTLDDLGDKYDNLDKLTRGTEEWNEAVQDINGTVMELIQKYPQLADFLKAESGVLTLDIDSAGVQEVIIQAQVASIVTQNAAKRAEQGVMAAQKVVDIGNSAGVSALAEKRRSEVFWHDTGAGAAIGAGTGAAAGAITGAVAGAGILSGPLALILGALGTVAGGVVGTVAGAVTGAIRGEAEANAVKSDKELQENIAEASKKLATEGKTASYNNLLNAFIESGIDPEDAEVLATEYAKDGKAFVKLGQELVAYDEQMKAFSTAMAESARTLVKMPEVLKDNVEGQNTFWNTLDAVLDETDYQRFYEEEVAKIESGTVSLTEEDKKRFVEQIGGKGAKLEDGKIVDSEGETLVENADEDYFKSLLAEEKATKRFASAGDATYNFLKKAKTYIPTDVASDDLVERLFSDKDGLELHKGEADALKNIDVSTLWRTLTTAEKDLFGSKQGLQDYINNAITKSQEAFRGSLGFEGVTARAAKNLTNVAEETEMNDPKAFADAFNTALQNAEDTEDAEIFKQLVGSIDPESAGQREVWEQIASNLEAQGVTLTQGMQDFFDTALTQAKATYSNEWLSGMGASDELISQYQAALAREDSATVDKFHETFKKWKQDYDTVNSEAAKAEHELMEKTVDAIVESREKQIDAYEEAVNAEAEANSNLISKISDNVARLRELREKEETERAISENLSKQAYLGMDTSGGNSLELLKLQEENEQMTQDYEDQMVDQALSRLEEDNQKALEQREKQIEIMRQQLDAYANSEQILTDAKQIIADATEKLTGGGSLEGTALYDLLKPERFISELEEGEFLTNLTKTVSELVEATVPDVTIETTTKPPPPPPPSPGNRGANLVPIEKGSSYTKVSLKYATGGLADFTGPAWLDGTKSRPEYVLNADQTERFFSLVDVLERLDSGEGQSGKTGDSYFDININVEKIEDDYDVEQMADKIRRMIYDDASYRNVNAINHIR